MKVEYFFNVIYMCSWPSFHNRLKSSDDLERFCQTNM